MLRTKVYLKFLCLLMKYKISKFIMNFLKKAIAISLVNKDNI